MIDLIAVVCERLQDTEMVALLARGPDDEVAVYAEGLVPAKFNYTTKPLIIVEDPQHGGNEDTFDQAYRRESVGLRLYHKPDEDYLPLITAAEWARKLFENWGPTSIDGGEVVNSTVSGPTRGPTTDPTLAGRVLRINFLIKETN